jgi:hypothetical protein
VERINALISGISEIEPEGLRIAGVMAEIRTGYLSNTG